jgi:hypothetical protein
MKKIAALLGDYYHSFDTARDSLEAALQPLTAAGELDILYVTAEQLTAVLADGPDAVVLFKENRINPQDAQANSWMTDGTADAINQYVENGGSWIALHSGLASYPEDGAYVNMLRGYFKYHPNQHQLVTYTGEFRFQVVEEQYFVHCEEQETDVFLRAESVDGGSVAGWRHEHGSGRVCCLTPAHNRPALLHPDFLQLLAGCVVWCCDK